MYQLAPILNSHANHNAAQPLLGDHLNYSTSVYLSLVPIYHGGSSNVNISTYTNKAQEVEEQKRKIANLPQDTTSNLCKTRGQVNVSLNYNNVHVTDAVVGPLCPRKYLNTVVFNFHNDEISIMFFTLFRNKKLI